MSWAVFPGYPSKMLSLRVYVGSSDSPLNDDKPAADGETAGRGLDQV
jgi:hypothetical protein